MINNIVSVIIKIYGRVQGVFLRHNTCQKANELDIVGYISNLPDGSVFIQAQGEEEKLKELIVWIKSSPGQSKMEQVEVEWAPSEEKFDGFNIRY